MTSIEFDSTSKEVWKHIFKLPCLTTKENKIQAFSCRIIKHAVPVNK